VGAWHSGHRHILDDDIHSSILHCASVIFCALSPTVLNPNARMMKLSEIGVDVEGCPGMPDGWTWGLCIYMYIYIRMKGVRVSVYRHVNFHAF
jgi:hypothetical protein